MKKIIYVSVFFAFSQLVTCCEAQAQLKPAAATTKNVPMHWLDLSPAGIEALIEVPETVKIIADPYDVIIGDGKTIFIEISQTSQSFAEIKDFVAKNDVRGFVKFTREDSNGFVAEMKALGQKEFDFSFFATIGGENYLIKDPGKYHHPNIDVVNAMYGYAKTIKAK